MKNITALALLSSLFTLPAIAAQDSLYQHEVGLEYQANTEKFGDGIWDVNYRYYAKPVTPDNGPYALNGFLAQTSNIGAGYSLFDAADTDTIRIDGTYVFDSKWFIGAEYNHFEVGSYSSNLYKIDAGYYFNDSSKISAFYVDGSDGFESYYGAEIRSFVDFETTTGIDLGAMWTHTDQDNIFNLNADWYITKAWSIGVDYINDGSDNNFAAKTAYWLRMSDSFSATFEVSKLIDSDADGIGASIGIVGRF
ncbi:putative porin [Shewanella sp. MMG014]|uniref:putative porin n=1 Tax=Shewanella sp. MMG014 TaxID=2822691 RepID=UPI001B35E427|nr:putative porin [Shewanella sp. MMG014]MBQ4892305.1 putative porin [Shewanella sp. MMG014]